jgi:hypothetical protein
VPFFKYIPTGNCFGLEEFEWEGDELSLSSSIIGRNGDAPGEAMIKSLSCLVVL